MAFAQTFESNDAEPGRAATLERLRGMLRDTGTAPEIRQRGPEDGGNIPVAGPLRPLIPGGALSRGTIVSVTSRPNPWDAPSYLEIALLAGATAGGAWAGIVGMPSFGIRAATELGADLSKVLMVDEPGERWAQAVSVLAGAVDMVLLSPPARPNGEQLRRIANRVRTTQRQRGAVLVVAGPWDGAHLSLWTHDATWTGVGEGRGHLTGRRVTVSSSGRGAGGMGRSMDLWLPDAEGRMREYVPAEDVVGGPVEEGWSRLRIA